MGADELSQASSLLLKSPHSEVDNAEDVPSKDFLERVHSFSKKKLGDLIKTRAPSHQDLGGQSELIATQELLDRFGEPK